MEKATLTIELNGKEYTKQTYSYRKAESVKKRLESVISKFKLIPHYSNATFTINF